MRFLHFRPTTAAAQAEAAAIDVADDMEWQEQLAADAEAGPVDMPARLVRAGDSYVTGSGRLREITGVLRGSGQVRIQLVDGWLFWLAGDDMVRISR